MIYFLKLLNLEVFWARRIIRWDHYKLERLIKNGLNVNAKDFIGRTILSWAIRSNEYSAVAILVEEGARLKDPGGYHALFDAIDVTNFDIVKLLCACDVNLEEESFGYTPLGWCCVMNAVIRHKNNCNQFEKLLKCVKIILDNGASPNHISGIGYSPLMLSVISKDLELFKIIYSSGGDLYKENQDGVSAMSLINEMSLYDFKKFLE